MSKITWPDFQCQIKYVSPKMSLEDGPANWSARLYLMGNSYFFFFKNHQPPPEVKKLFNNGKGGEGNWVVQNCMFPLYLFWVHLLDLYLCYWLSLRNLHRITSFSMCLVWQVESGKQISALIPITLGKCNCCLDSVTMTENSHSSRQTFWHSNCSLFQEGK